MTERAVLFDLDGTLYQERLMRVLFAPRFLLGVALSGGRLYREVAAWRGARESLRGGDHSSGGAYARALANEARRRLGDTADGLEDRMAFWMEQAPRAAVRGARRRGLRRTLRQLRAEGWSLGLFSDNPVDCKLEALGVDELFGATCWAGSAEVGALKPSPRGFLFLAESLGVSPGSCTVVGDRPELDGESARRAGMRFIPVGTRSPDGLARFSDLPALLRGS